MGPCETNDSGRSTQASISEIRSRLISCLKLKETENKALISKTEKLHEPNHIESPPNIGILNDLGPRAKCSFDSNSSQSPSLSKVIHFVNCHDEQIRKRSEEQYAEPYPEEINVTCDLSAKRSSSSVISVDDTKTSREENVITEKQKEIGPFYKYTGK